ncbi:Actin-related protein 4 [Galdieria sulphuraria]|nr:Actin-related protein 4 [Galdieria sulphuraria]
MPEWVRVGDDVGAVIIELGTWYFRIGYAGDDSPKLLIRNLYGVNNKGSVEQLSCKRLRKGGSLLEEQVVSTDTIASAQEHSVTPSNTLDAMNETRVQEEGLQVSEPKKTSYFTPSFESPYLFFCDQCPFDWQFYEKDWSLSELLKKDGTLSDWQAFCCLLKQALTFLCVKPEDSACMFVESERGLQRETYLQLSKIVFQELSMRATFILNHATAATFASARTTALVVCVGHKGTSVVPVVEGFSLNRATVKSNLGGEFLTRILWKYFNEYSEVIDKEKIKPHGNLDLESLKIQRLVEDIKQSVCGLWNKKEDIVNSHGVPVEIFQYELAKGQFFRISRELSWKIPFVVFQPSSLNEPPLNGLCVDFVNEDGSIENIYQTDGICDMVLNALRKCDPDVRRDLIGNILLIGCSTLFPGFTKCFEDLLLEKMSPMYRVRTISVMLPEERVFASWIGGSIVASSVTFQQFWFSREEFMRSGPELILDKLI